MSNPAIQTFDLIAPDGKPYAPNCGGQLAFHGDRHRFRCLFGGKGAGKTTSLCVEALITAFEYPGTRILIGNRSETDLVDTTWKELLTLLPPALIIDGPKAQPLRVTVAGGTEIIGRHLSDARTLGSLNLGAFFIDEAHRLEDDEAYLELIARLRHPRGPGRGACAAYMAGRNWLWRRYMEDANTDHWGIQLSTYENQGHLPPGFVESLERSYSDRQQAQYLRAELVQDTGEIFWMFDPGKHVEEPFLVPEHWSRYLGVDLGVGQNDPAAVVFLAVDEQGVHHVYDLIYEHRLIISQQCELIQRKIGNDLIRWIALDPGSANKTSDQTGRQSLDIYREFLPGQHVWTGTPHKEAHIQQIQEMLRGDEHGPKLKIFAHLGPLIQEIRYWMRDSSGKPKDRDEHAISALRFCLSHRTQSAESPLQPPELSFGQQVCAELWARMKELSAEIQEDQRLPLPSAEGIPAFG